MASRKLHWFKQFYKSNFDLAIQNLMASKVYTLSIWMNAIVLKRAPTLKPMPEVRAYHIEIMPSKPQSLVESVFTDAWLSWSNLSSAADRVKKLFITLAPHRLAFKRNGEYYYLKQNIRSWRATNWLKYMFAFAEVVDEDRVDSNHWEYTV